MVFRAACWNRGLRLFNKDGWIMVYFKFRHSKIKIDWSLNMPYYKSRIALLGLNYLYYDMMVIRAACWNRQIKRLKLIEVYICFIIQPRLDKFVLLRLKAYNSSLEAAIGTCRTIFGFLRFSALIWAQEVQDFVHGTLRKLCLKRATLKWKWA